jgi:hypothetical protein
MTRFYLIYRWKFIPDQNLNDKTDDHLKTSNDGDASGRFQFQGSFIKINFLLLFFAVVGLWFWSRLKRLQHIKSLKLTFYVCFFKTGSYKEVGIAVLNQVLIPKYACELDRKKERS